jgi:hypothetical protein
MLWVWENFYWKMSRFSVVFYFSSEFFLFKGFEHEQNRLDRDNFVIVNFTNIQTGKDWWINFLIKNPNSFHFVLGAEDQFQKKLRNYDYQNEAYDLGSIMHYSSYSFSSNGFPTILTRAGAIIPEHYDSKLVSNTDVTSLRKAYGCKLIKLNMPNLAGIFRHVFFKQIHLPKAENFIEVLN